jgi:protein phosphatase 2C family protein 2/3
MEDAHVVELSLDEGVETSNAFFAVYDGHSGAFSTGCRFFIYPFSFCSAGGAMSKFAGGNVHKSLVSEGAYHEKRYEEALKSAFLGTDEDWRASQFHIFCCQFPPSQP